MHRLLSVARAAIPVVVLAVSVVLPVPGTDHPSAAASPIPCGWQANHPGTRGSMGFTVTEGITAMPLRLVVRTTTGTPATTSVAVDHAIAAVNAASGAQWRRGPDVTPHPRLSTADRTHRPPVGELWVVGTARQFPGLPPGNYAHFHTATDPDGHTRTASPMVVLSPTSVARNPLDRQTRTILHEFGHVAGLDHHFTPWEGRCPLMGYGRETTLGSGDIAGLRWLAGRSPFVDIGRTGRLAAATRWAFDVGVVSGTNGTARFAPRQPVSRGEMVTMLWRAAGSPSPPPGTPRFRDVPPGAPFADAVAWSTAAGITATRPGGRFMPNRQATRGEVTMALWRFNGAPPMPVNAATVRSMGNSRTLATAHAWIHHHGINSGVWNPDRPAPGHRISRAGLVTMLWHNL